MITYDPKTASGFQKLSSSAIEIGNIPLITGPIFGIILSVEVNSLFAVSLLTIAGYSVNDTVVIFDRIRENLKSNKEGYNETIQLSVNESFRRTTFTSITTLIPLVSIILFGSYSLFWFSLALSLGIIVGSYSSILLAPSLLLKDWA